MENETMELKEAPSVSWVRETLKNLGPKHYRVLGAFILANAISNTMDIAVIIPPMNRPSINISREYNSNVKKSQRPQWNGKTVDFQFFYPFDIELGIYSMKELPEE